MKVRWQRRGRKRAPLSGGHMETWGSLPHLAWVTAPTLQLRQGPYRSLRAFLPRPWLLCQTVSIWPFWWSQGIGIDPPFTAGAGVEGRPEKCVDSGLSWTLAQVPAPSTFCAAFGVGLSLPFPRHQMGIILRSQGDNVRINWVCVVPGRVMAAVGTIFTMVPTSQRPWAEQGHSGAPGLSSLPHWAPLHPLHYFVHFSILKSLNIFLLMVLGFNVCSFWLTWSLHIIHIKCWVQ